MNRSLQTVLQELNLMAEGIPDHLEKLSSVGISLEVADELKQLKAKLEKLDSEQEKLKADLKLKTELLEQSKKEAIDRYSELRKLVKIKVDQVSWKAFGIEDKR